MRHPVCNDVHGWFFPRLRFALVDERRISLGCHAHPPRQRWLSTLTKREHGTHPLHVGVPLVSLLLWVTNAAVAAAPFQATGFKVGEVTPTSAIVWTRLTLREARNPSDGPRVTIHYHQPAVGAGRRDRTVKSIEFPGGVTVGDLREAVPGADGAVRVLYKADQGLDSRESEWRDVDPLGDFTRQFALSDLKPNTRYSVRVESRGTDGAAGQVLEGSFRTALPAEEVCRVVFTAATCFGNDDQDSPEGFKIYGSMAKLDPDFFVNLGDIIYYDELAKTAELARYHWQRMYSWPGTVAFHRQVASFFIKDDHDAWRNDCWPTMQSPFMHEFTFRQGQAIFREQVPMAAGEPTYRTRRFGRDLQVWLVEGRDFRMPNDMPDNPQKTVWGETQKRWFKDTLAASDATFRILLSPTPLVGPDRANKHDNHSNAGFQHEGRELREFLAAQKNTLVICGDRHWQYMSVDPATKLREYSVGAASDAHAGGWQQEDYRPDYHKFLRVAGGFLSVTVERPKVAGTLRVPSATITVRHHDVDGGVKHEDRWTADAPAK
jgi:alkaline phosphatase D